MNSSNFLRFFSLLVVLVVFSSCTSISTATLTKPEIETIMREQSQAWNQGNLEGFMAPYWQSDSLLFIGKSGPTYGWENTLENYKRSYPNQEAMGQLTFTLVHTDPLGPNAVLVVGKWHLRRRMGDLQGYFSLVFKKIGATWKIVADHSS